MTNDEAQSSSASFPLRVRHSRYSAQQHAALLEKIQSMGLVVDASAMRADSRPESPYIHESFFNVSDYVWDGLARRQKHYRNFGGIHVQFQLQKNPNASEYAHPVHGFFVRLAPDYGLRDATVNLIPMTNFSPSPLSQSIDNVILGEIAPRITRRGVQADYPALLKSISRMAFENPVLLTRSEPALVQCTDEKILAQHLLRLLVNRYLASYGYATAFQRRSQKPDPQKAFKCAQQLGMQGTASVADVEALLQAYADHFPGYTGGDTYILRDASHSAINPGGHEQQQTLNSYTYFQGPIVSVDSAQGSVRQGVCDASRSGRECEHANIGAHMLQRIEVMRSSLTNEPVALEVIQGVTHVAPLECAQRLSLDTVYVQGIIPRTADIVRVNATLQEVTPDDHAYEGQFVGTTAHHIYLLNKRGKYEAHLKCLFKPQDVAAAASGVAPWNGNVSIRYAGPLSQATLEVAKDKKLLKKMQTWFSPSPARPGNSVVGLLLQEQGATLIRASKQFLGNDVCAILHPTLTSWAQDYSAQARVLGQGDVYDAVVPAIPVVQNMGRDGTSFTHSHPRPNGAVLGRPVLPIMPISGVSETSSSSARVLPPARASHRFASPAADEASSSSISLPGQITHELPHSHVSNVSFRR